jgi:RND family efflux transporter MFP subunit
MICTRGISSISLMRGAGFGVALALATFVAGCGQGDGKKAAAPPPPPAVTVAKPEKRTVSDYDEYVGRFTAVNSVEVRARVSGYLDSVDFKDGQMVKQGDLLFTIDKRPFQNSVAQARGTLAQAKANLAFAEADLDRAKQMLKGIITEQTFDQRTQAFRGAQASVAANEAAVKQAELDLDFTELRAPVAGRIGDRRVSPGNLVTGGTGTTTMLASIVSLDPIRFEFTMDEASYLRYERFSKSGKDVTGRDGGVNVELKLLDEKDFVHHGAMDFVDNAIDRSSGTIRGRAVFANPDMVFTPGMFGRIRVPGSPTYTALLLPDAAIGTEQIRKYVLVVGDDNVAAQKFVTLGPVTDDGLRIVKSGIKVSDRVIVNGLMRARAGQKVTPQEQGAPGGPAGPQAKN